MSKAHYFRIIVSVSLLLPLALAVLSCSPSLSTESQPSSGGFVTPSNGSYDNGLEISLTATANPGYRFDHWEGSASGKAPSVRLTMSGNKNAIAVFKKTYALAVSTSPSGGGTVSPKSGTYDEGQTVTLIAAPSQYYEFNGWGGDVSGSANPTTITMNSDKRIVASFAKIKYSLQTSTGATGAGKIEPSGGSFDAGTTVKVTAVPAQGYRFREWETTQTGTSGSPVRISVPANAMWGGNTGVSLVPGHRFSVSALGTWK